MEQVPVRLRRRAVVDNRELARTIGARIRAARQRAGLTQQELAGDRYTKAYISALELGHAKPSMAALDYLAPRLGTTPDRILAEPGPRWTRLDADLHLAAGRYEQAVTAYEDLLERTTDRAARAEVQLALGEARCRLSRITEAAGPLAEAVRAFEGLGRRADANRCRYWLAFVHHRLDDVDEARRLLHGLLATDADMEDPDFDVRVRIALAQVEAAQGNHERALAYLEEARETVGRLDLRRQAIWHDSLARARQSAGDIEGAIRAGLDALALFRALDASHAAVNIANELALTFLRLGNLARARELADEARREAERIGETLTASAAEDTLASIALAGGDPEAALRLADAVLARPDDEVALATRLTALLTRARALGVLGRDDEAAATWASAGEAAVGSPSVARRREVFAAWAGWLADEGRHAEAYDVMRRALEG